MANGFGGRLRAFLGLDTSEFDRNLRRSGQNVRGFGGEVQSSLTGAIASATGFGKTFAAGMAGGVLTAAFAGVNSNIRQTITSIAAIGDEAKRAGMSLEAFQEWKFIAEQNRIGVDSLVDGFKELNLRADEFIVTGKGSAAEAFERLGYNAEDLAKKLEDPSELMLEIMGRVGRLDRAAQIRVFDELLGGTGGERFVELLGQGETKLRSTIRLAHEAGAVMDAEMVRRADELDRKFGEIETRIGTFFRQSIVDFGDDLAGLQGEVQSIIDIWNRLTGSAPMADQPFLDVQQHAAQAASELRDLADAAGSVDGAAEIRALADEFENLAAQYNQGEIDGDTLARRTADVAARAEEATSALEDLNLTGFDEVLARLGAIGDALLRVSGLARDAGDAVPEAPKVYSGRGDGSFEWRETYAPESSARPEGRTFKASEDAIWGPEVTEKGGDEKKDEDKYKAAVEAIREETAALESEAVALLAVARSGKEYADAIEFARTRAELLHAAQQEGKDITPELKAEIDRLAQSYVDAGQKAGDAADQITRIEENSRRGAEAISDIFVGLLNGSKDAKDAINSLLSEIARVQAQKALLSMPSMGGAVGWLGSLLSLPGNAGGTENWRGGMTRIHELGGEIMNLPQGTQIIPHDISKRMADGAVSRTRGNTSISLTTDLRGTTGDKELDARIQRSQEALLEQLPSYLQEHDLRN